MIKIKISMPHKNLQPNSRVHWSKKVAPKQIAYNEGYCLTKQDANYKIMNLESFGEFINKLINADKIKGIMVYHPKNGNRMDLDNCLASCKAHIDGMSKALKINDKKIQWQTELGECDKANPHIELILTI